MPRTLELGLAASLLLAGCRIATGEDSDIAFVPQVSTPVLTIGDTARVRVTVTNERTESITIEGNHCNQHFEVRDARGRIIGPVEAIGCLGIIIPVVLDPGESHTLEGFWSGRLSGTAAAQVSTQYAPPGTYHIRGRAFLHGQTVHVTGGHVPIDVRVSATQ